MMLVDRVEIYLIDADGRSDFETELAFRRALDLIIGFRVFQLNY